MRQRSLMLWRQLAIDRVPEAHRGTPVAAALWGFRPSHLCLRLARSLSLATVRNPDPRCIAPSVRVLAAPLPLRFSLSLSVSLCLFLSLPRLTRSSATWPSAAFLSRSADSARFRVSLPLPLSPPTASLFAPRRGRGREGRGERGETRNDPTQACDVDRSRTNQPTRPPSHVGLPNRSHSFPQSNWRLSSADFEFCPFSVRIKTEFV